MTSFKGGFCERCLKHVSQHEEDCIHTCTPTKGWWAMEQRLEAAEKLIALLSFQLDQFDCPESVGCTFKWIGPDPELIDKALAAAKAWKEGV